MSLLFTGYVVATPYITVQQIRSAVAQRDSAALSEHIDFSSVRQSIKDQMNAMVMRDMAKDTTTSRNPFTPLGVVLAGTMVDKMVDAYVTPAGIAQLMAGEKLQSTGAAKQHKAMENTSMSYESLNTFVVRIMLNEGESRFVLRRNNVFWWVVTDIVMPVKP